MAKSNFYITTAIDYVNAKPHIGHAFEKALADTLARWQRLQGKKVYFITGVDENAQKNVLAAEKAGVPVKEFVDKNAGLFIELCKKLDLSNDDFIRTTAKQHAEVVQSIVKKMIAVKDIYKGNYSGLYCVGCETYYTEKDLVNGKCPEHKTVPEKRTEEAYFFKLSKYKNQLLKLIPKYVVPLSRANEIIVRINDDGLNDICVSRKGASWGINFPDDINFKIWVWIDALINYISGLKEKEKQYWPADVHVVGKGINWFHSVIWPALLLSAGYKLPEKLLVHGYLNVGGEKISKSLGNTIDPLELLNKYSSDAVRYALLKSSVFNDTDFSEEILIQRNNNELANKLGNLVSRVSTLAEIYGLESCAKLKLDSKLLVKKVNVCIAGYEFDKALSEIFAFIDLINEYVQAKKPWETQDKKVLWVSSNAIKDVAILLSPFIPSAADKISKVFNFEIALSELDKPLKVSKIKKAEILFKKVELAQNVLVKGSGGVVSGKVDEKLKVKSARVKSASVLSVSKEAPVAGSIEPVSSSKVPFADFAKLDLRVGKILEVNDHPKADKLYVLTVDLGEGAPRTIVAGLKKFYSKEELVGKKAVFVANLAPANLRGVESNGMILAAVEGNDEKVVFLLPEKDLKIGSKVE